VIQARIAISYPEALQTGFMGLGRQGFVLKRICTLDAIP